jgi:hypothetical protein
MIDEDGRRWETAIAALGVAAQTIAVLGWMVWPR